jgi:non-specific serine/threonine protein kinase
VDLASVDDPAVVSTAVAAALGILERRQGTVEDDIVSALSAKQALIIFDNCEHVIDACASLVDRITRGCPHVTVIATSRESLDVDGEAIAELRPLAVPVVDEELDADKLLAFDAVRLFVERARRVRRTFALDRANAGAVAELCRRMDGIPLAIELAAAKVQMIGPADILKRLASRTGTFEQERTRRSTSTRHDTLRSAIDWSYDLLTQVEQRVFMRLSVFAGTFSLEAAEAVTNEASDGDSYDALTHLIGKSMVQADDASGDVRYRVLEPLREYAAARLDAEGNANDARARHAHYFLSFAQDAAPHFLASDDRDWVAKVDREYDNIRVAMSWIHEHEAASLVRFAAALVLYWQQQALLREGLSRIQLALASAPADTDEVAELAARAGYMAIRLARYEEAAQLLEASSRSSATMGRESVPFAHVALGLLALVDDRSDDARTHSRTSLEIARRNGIEYDEVECLASLSMLLISSSATEDAEAIALADEAVELARRIGNGFLLALALQAAGGSRYRTQPAAALQLLDECIAIAGHRNVDSVAEAQMFKALAYLCLGQLAGSATEFREVLARFESIGEDYYESVVLGVVAQILGACGMPDPAVRLLASLDRARADSGRRAAALDIKTQQRLASKLEHVLAPDVYAEAWNSGRRMSLSEAVVLALKNLGQLSHATPAP